MAIAGNTGVECAGRRPKDDGRLQALEEMQRQLYSRMRDVHGRGRGPQSAAGKLGGVGLNMCLLQFERSAAGPKHGQPLTGAHRAAS